MSRFIQLHFLTVYPLSNPNRDDLGRPKSANFGGYPRLRISSQAIKRAARISDAMQNELSGHMGERTQRIGEIVEQSLIEQGTLADEARDIAKKIADVFGKLDPDAEKDKDDKKGVVRTRQLAFISPDERKAALEWAQKASIGEKLPSTKELKKLVLRPADGAVDVAMFGRMLADDPEFNREAAVQVSHALTTHRAVIEDDFYTAVDDLKSPSEDAGAGFVGDAGFGSGIYYLYVCIDTALLLENLDGNTELADRAVQAVTEAFATATPSGKRNSFAHHTRAEYIRAEHGDQQPRSLAGAFFDPVRKDFRTDSIAAIEDTAAKMDAAYGACADATAVMNVPAGQGSLSEIKSFVSGAMRND